MTHIHLYRNNSDVRWRLIRRFPRSQTLIWFGPWFALIHTHRHYPLLHKL